MQICSYHLDALRAALTAHGHDTRMSTGTKNPLFKAQGMILAEAARQGPDLVDAKGCPVCILMVPSWIAKVARALPREETKQ